MRLHRLPGLRLGMCLFIAWTLGGCSYAPLNIKDSSAPSAQARALVRFGNAQRGGLELEVGQVRGSDVQQLESGVSTRVGNQTLVGPVTLDHEARLRHYHVVYNHLLFAGRPVEMEWFAGAEAFRLDWVSRPTAPAQPELRERRSLWGPTAGLVGRWNITPLVALEARGGGMATLVGNPSDRGRRGFGELAAVLRPTPGLRLRAGYAESNARSWINDLYVDDSMSFKTRGPFLGLAYEWR